MQLPSEGVLYLSAGYNTLAGHGVNVTRNDPVTRLVGYVVGPPVEWIGRRVERRVRRAVPVLPVWVVPVVVAISFVGAVVVQLRANPFPGRSEPEEPASEEDAVAEALETLNVEYPPVPEESEVRARYRSLALESHPDQGGDADRFIEVQKAWEVVTEGEELTDRVQEMEVTQGS